jgi:hypothetical protein
VVITDPEPMVPLLVPDAVTEYLTVGGKLSWSWTVAFRLTLPSPMMVVPAAQFAPGEVVRAGVLGGNA